jgi:tryptophanyl-tRNA synthetase
MLHPATPTDDPHAAPFTPRVLTGDRPTGPLHLGHLFGTLENRVRLQDQGVELFVLVADYQTITDRDSPGSLPGDVEGLLADYLAVGIDPARAAAPDPGAACRADRRPRLPARGSARGQRSRA